MLTEDFKGLSIPELFGLLMIHTTSLLGQLDQADAGALPFLQKRAELQSVLSALEGRKTALNVLPLTIV